jgi:type VI protein secretion system component Hcp
MAFDAYIKFGEGTFVFDGRPIPLFPGDSDDDAHFWWCELRGCDFQLEADEHSENETETTQDKKGEKPRPELKAVTIKKRVDWASTSLFNKCCEAGEANNKKIDDQGELDPKGRIKKVTVEVCRQSGVKFPFLIIEYSGVTVTKYAIDMSGPEPSETITFEAEVLKYTYQRTDPETGAKKDGPVRSGALQNYTQQNQASQATSVSASGTAASAASSSPGGSGSGGGSGAAAATTATDGDGTHVGLVSAMDAAVNSNYPGLQQGTGFGLLPD